MQTQLDCIPCFIRQALSAIRQVSDDEVVINNTIKRVLKEASTFDLSLSPPEMGQIIHSIIKQESGVNDPYLKIKQRSTKCAISLSGEVSTIINESEDPFKTAVRFAIAGNIMDFALLQTWDMDKIKESFNKAVCQCIDENQLHLLKIEVKRAKTILVLGDNAGETVFDKLLISHFPKEAKIYYATKDAPIINDATINDAIEAGLQEVSQIISNGTDAPGTLLDKCSEEFISIYNTCDVIIAKGQANFETLNFEKRKIYFLTQIKCSVIASRYNYKVGDWIVTTTKELEKQERETIQ